MALLRRKEGGGGERGSGRWSGAGVEGGGEGGGVKLYAHRAHCTDAYAAVSCTYSQNLDMQCPSLVRGLHSNTESRHNGYCQ